MEVEADDGVEAVIEGELVPLPVNEIFVGIAAGGVHLLRLGASPADEARVANGSGAAQTRQRQAEVTRSLGGSEAVVVAEDQDRRGHPARK